MAVKRALISVSNKAGVIDFARELVKLGAEIVSTGGTAKALQGAGVPVTYISDVTGFPEILGGRVKTLHPVVHGGILALRNEEHLSQLKEHNITPIDLVIVNLYPFRETIAKPGVTPEEAIENIDIGGPAMVRASAKNFENVLVVVNPERYKEVLEALKGGEDSRELRLSLAMEAFAHTATYDAAVAAYLEGLDAGGHKLFPPTWNTSFKLAQVLRYGENPHQQAAFYRDPSAIAATVGTAAQLSGKELSYNNILDLNSALEIAQEFIEPAAVIVKHNNPCGCASTRNLAEAYRRAYEADPVSAFGGIVAFNRIVDAATAEEMVKIFLEAVIAPDFDEDALNILKQKSALRILKTGGFTGQTNDLEIRKVAGGLLVQEVDRIVMRLSDTKVVTRREPTREEMQELMFAMTVVKHVKSNAIVVTRERQLVGVGAGQMNRVGSARIALEQAGEKARGAVMGSDAFFPFNDTVHEAAKAGITAIIQPGGSVRDEESIKAADEYGIAMVFTGIRHFKH